MGSDRLFLKSDLSCDSSHYVCYFLAKCHWRSQRDAHLFSLFSALVLFTFRVLSHPGKNMREEENLGGGREEISR